LFRGAALSEAGLDRVTGDHMGMLATVMNALAMRDALYDRLSYDKVLADKLSVMDSTAICLCQDHNMPVRVFQMDKAGALLRIVVGEDEGTLIEEDTNSDQ